MYHLDFLRVSGGARIKHLTVSNIKFKLLFLITDEEQDCFFPF